MNVRLILDFASTAEAAEALNRIGNAQASAKIADPIDNPEFGAHVMAAKDGAGKPIAVPLPPAGAPVVQQPTGLAAVGFGQGVALPAGAIPIPAPASAVAAPNGTVPAMPSGTPVTPSVSTVPVPPSVPAAAAPTAPAAPTMPAPAGVQVDSTGLPWDARIHAKTKTFNKDGTWRQARELDPTLKAQVEAELRAVLAANALAANGVAIPPAATPAVPQVTQTPVTATVVPTPVTPAPVPVAAPTASPSEFQWTFGTLMERMTPRMMDGGLTTDQVSAALGKYGLSAVGQLALSPNIVPLLAADLGIQP